VIPGQCGFVAQLNEGRHLKKRPTEFRVDKVLQPFDGNKFNFTKVGQEEVLFQFEASNIVKLTSPQMPLSTSKILQAWLPLMMYRIHGIENSLCHFLGDLKQYCAVVWNSLLLEDEDLQTIASFKDMVSFYVDII